MLLNNGVEQTESFGRSWLPSSASWHRWRYRAKRRKATSCCTRTSNRKAWARLPPAEV